jgi:hypothetical protein
MKQLIPLLAFVLPLLGCSTPQPNANIPADLQLTKIPAIADRGPSATIPICALYTNPVSGFLFDQDSNQIAAWHGKELPKSSQVEIYIKNGTCSKITKYVIRDLLAAVYLKALKDSRACVLYLHGAAGALYNSKLEKIDMWS